MDSMVLFLSFMKSAFAFLWTLPVGFIMGLLHVNYLVAAIVWVLLFLAVSGGTATGRRLTRGGRG